MQNKETKIQLKSQIFTEREKKNKDSKISIFVYRFLLMAFIVVNGYVLIFSSFLRIENINVSGNIEITASDIKKEVTALSGEKYFSFFPKDNLLIFPSSFIKNKLLDKFKKISKVEIVKRFPNIVDIKVTERKSLLIWCSGESCFLVDENGYAYLAANFESEEIKQNNLIRINDESQKPLELNTKIVQEDYMAFILNAKNIIKQEAGVDIEDTYYIPSSMAEEFSVKTTGGTILKISTQISLEKVLKNMQAFFLKKESPVDSLEKLEYIDLRNEDKIFYKIKGNSSENTSNEQKN
jgi:cell division septal protein FtsQ